MKLKRNRSPRKVIEATKDATKEHMYMKLPGEQMEEVTLYSDAMRSKPDEDKIKRLLKEYEDRQHRHLRVRRYKNRTYTQLHTHVHDEARPFYDLGGAKIPKTVLPSTEDFRQFLGDELIRFMVIAQRNEKTREVGGYLIFKKTKKTPASGPETAKEIYGDAVSYSNSMNELYKPGFKGGGEKGFVESKSLF